MNKYAISWISFFDNKMHMKITTKASEEEALKRAYLYLTGVEYNSTTDDIDIKEATFNRDGMIGAIEVEGCCFGG